MLNPGITVDGLLHSFDRQVFEAVPFDLALHYLGGEVESEPWGRRICDQVWSFETECIDGAGDYIQIVQRLCRMTGDAEYLTDIQDHVDLEAGEGWLEYTTQGRRQRWTTEVNDDWADLMAVCYVMDHLQCGGKQFYSTGSGQEWLLFYLDADTADNLSQVTGKSMVPVTPD